MMKHPIIKITIKRKEHKVYTIEHNYKIIWSSTVKKTVRSKSVLNYYAINILWYWIYSMFEVEVISIDKKSLKF